MNNNALQIILYSAIFSTAYAGFFYQKYVDAGVTPDMTKIRLASSGAVASIKTAALQVNTSKDSRRNQTSSQYDSRPVATAETAATEKVRREKGRLNDKIKIHNAASRKTSGRHNSGLGNSSHDTQPFISSPAASSGDQRDHSYSQNQTETITSTDSHSSTTTLDYAANPVTFTSAPALTATAGNAISSYDTPATTDTDTTTKANNNADSQENSFAGNTLAGDGSEFLPDGSSQQDLVDSLSKKPRVYTIEDYQQADISCTSAYSSPTAHAELIYGLKGC